MSLSRLLLILGVLQISSFPSFTGKLDVLATFLMLADLLMLVGDDGELPAISASSAADEFVDFLNVPGVVPLPKWEWEFVDFLNVPGGLPLPNPLLASEE